MCWLTMACLAWSWWKRHPDSKGTWLSIIYYHLAILVTDCFCASKGYFILVVVILCLSACYVSFPYFKCFLLLFYFHLQDSEGLIVLNIGSYMGGVDLWQNDSEHDDDDFRLQSMHDKVLEVVCICGAWHLGKLQVWDLFMLFF